LRQAAAGFQSISTQGVINGCVGVIDGWLCPIITPARNVVGNVRTYYSGHYQWYGMNVQAVVDHACRFMFLAVAAPGSQPDVNAIANTSLPQYLEQLPLGYYIIGDNAYPPSEHLVPVFGSGDRRNEDNDNANFFFSQCRIRVEMAFGLMTQRFGLLSRSLRVHPRNIGTLMETIARLHNFIINHTQDVGGDEVVPINDTMDNPSVPGTKPLSSAPTPNGQSIIR